jgi:DNA-binding transcriptional ArsR family regulator
MLRAAERVMNARKRRRAREKWTDSQGRERTGRGSFTPTTAEPLLVVVIEESPDVLADDVCRRIVAGIAKKGRKHGVAVYIVTQIPSLAELGNDLTIRALLSSTNIVMFRTSDRLSKQMGIPGDLPVDPAKLPSAWPDGSPTAGLGYLAAAGGRISPMRAHYVEDPYHWATVEADVAQLEQTAIEAAGEDYLTWPDRRAAGDDELEDSPPISVPPAGADVARATPGLGRTTTRDAILALLMDRGHVHTGVVAHHLNVPLPTVSQTLRRLEGEGLARQARKGIWTHTDHAPTSSTSDDETDVA